MTGARPTIDELVVGDAPEAWSAAGFSVDGDCACRIGSVRVRLAGGEGGKGIRAWSLRGVPEDIADIDGLATTAGHSPTAEGAVHPNGVTSLDHIVLLSPDGDRTAAAVTKATGLDVRRIRETSSYGSPMRQWFFRLGEVILELVAPDRSTSESGNSGGAPTFFGLAMNVADIDALAAFYGEHIGAAKDAVQPGRRIASLRHKALSLSVPIAFMSAEPLRR